MCMGIGNREERGKKGKREKREGIIRRALQSTLFTSLVPLYRVLYMRRDITLPTRTNALQRITAHLGAYLSLYSP